MITKEALANKLAYALQANETPEEKRKREKAQMEAADNELTADLMGSSSGVGRSKPAGSNSGIASVSLKNKQDHVNFALTVSTKLSSSTGFCVSAFYRELTARVQNNLSSEVLNEVITSLTDIRDAMKEKKEAVAPKKGKMTAKQQKQRQKSHEDVFGGNYDEEDEFGDKYGQLEEDHMF